jgi:hypothetical protein
VTRHRGFEFVMQLHYNEIEEFPLWLRVRWCKHGSIRQ